MIDDEGGVHWIEEPIRADDFEGCAKVADAVASLDLPAGHGREFARDSGIAIAGHATSNL